MSDALQEKLNQRKRRIARLHRLKYPTPGQRTGLRSQDGTSPEASEEDVASDDDHVSQVDLIEDKKSVMDDVEKEKSKFTAAAAMTSVAGAEHHALLNAASSSSSSQQAAFKAEESRYSHENFNFQQTFTAMCDKLFQQQTEL